LKVELKKCTMCNLQKHRTQVVAPLIKGTAPQIMYLGEAPGKTEDKLGIPFVGRSGKWHQHIEKIIDVPCVVTNCVQCRPVTLDGNGKPAGNGKPTLIQMMKCKVWIKKILNNYNIRLIVLYGTYPIIDILGFSPPIAPYVGKFYEITIDGNNVIAFATYHPACLCRNKKKYVPIFNRHIKLIKKFLYEGEQI